MNTLEAEVAVPDWANWIAVDKDGTCYAFADKPVKRARVWDVSGFSASRILYRGKPPKNWKEELYTWG